MKTNSPKVSVIMPCYNCQSTLSRATDSILNQSFTDLELILINDGSTDRTDEIIETYLSKDQRVKRLNNEVNRGLAYSLNRGIELAQATIIARMDADDWSYPERLKSQYDFLMSYPGIDILGGGILNVKQNGEELSIDMLPEEHADIVKRIFIKPILYHPTIMVRKEVFEKYGRYDGTLRWAEDADLWYRIYEKVKFHNLSQVLLKYTVKESLSLKIISNNLKVKYNNLRRQRKLLWGLPILARDLVVMSVKGIKNF